MQVWIPREGDILKLDKDWVVTPKVGWCHQNLINATYPEFKGRLKGYYFKGEPGWGDSINTPAILIDKLKEIVIEKDTNICVKSLVINRRFPHIKLHILNYRKRKSPTILNLTIDEFNGILATKID